MIQLLLNKGYDINEEYRAIIRYNLGYDTASYLELLIDNGIKFKEADESGWTALHWAAYHNAYDCAKVLIQYPELNRETTKAYVYRTLAGAYDEKFVYKAGLLPADIAKLNGHTEIVKVLKE
jgi:ankyrin repeat protein